MTETLPYGGPRVPAQLDVLSPRERDVLELICDGRSNSEIAAELFVAPNTVQKHAARIYEKLQARNRAHAAVLALRGGIIEPRVAA